LGSTHGFPLHREPEQLLVDFHIVYAGVLVYLIAKRAGDVWGLDGWAEKLAFVQQNPALRTLIA